MWIPKTGPEALTYTSSFLISNMVASYLFNVADFTTDAATTTVERTHRCG